MPGKPITASQLGERLRARGIYAIPGRRAALTDLAAKMPAAYSPTCCASHQAPRSDGCTTQEATGPATPPNSPGTRSPDLTNASAAETGPAPLDMIGTLPVTSSDAKVPLQLIMAKDPAQEPPYRHALRQTRRLKPGGEAVAEITGILGPSRRKH